MQLGDELGIEAVALGGGVAGVRTAAGDDRAQDEHDSHQGSQPQHQQPQQRLGQQARRLVALGAAPEQQRGGRDHDHRGQEVHHHHPWVEVGEHGDAAEHRLQRHCAEQQPGEHGDVPATWPRTHRDDDGRHADGDQDGDQQPVSQLDPVVVGGRLVRGAGQAVRPGRAAETGVGQPDSTAGGDERHVGDQRRDRRPAHGGRGRSVEQPAQTGVRRLLRQGNGGGHRLRWYGQQGARTAAGRPHISAAARARSRSCSTPPRRSGRRRRRWRSTVEPCRWNRSGRTARTPR